MSDFDCTYSTAQILTNQDTLKNFRSRFYLPEETIYLDGNSLGLLSRDAEMKLRKTVDEWKNLGIRGWLEADSPWFVRAEMLGEEMASHVGAEKSEVVATGATTVNIYSAISSFYAPEGNRSKILADELNFPTDLYALKSLLGLLGRDPAHHLLIVGSDDSRTLSEDRIIESMTPEIALIFLPSVLYRSGQLLDMERLSREARQRNIPIGFDCSHSAGIVPHRLHQWGVDFAVWCSYKYMNGGPGSPAFLYIHEDHHRLGPGLAGWFGYNKEEQFKMCPDFEHQHSAGGWQISTPSILGFGALEGALQILKEAGIEQIRSKSLQMTSYLMYLIDKKVSSSPYDFRIGTPRQPS